MSVYLLVDQSGTVVNSVVWDGDIRKWQPPMGLTIVPYDGPWGDGWKWDGDRAYDPNPPPPAPSFAPPPRPADGGPTDVS